MRSFVRSPQPAALVAWRTWGREYAAARASDAGYRFRWRTVGGQSVDVALREELLRLTDSHCAFCDTYELTRGDRTPTIEHFLPKSRFPLRAFFWWNLFPCCTECQRASNRYCSSTTTAAPLKPDHPSYRFARYFMAELSTGEIKPNPAATEEEQALAARTITAYQLGPVRNRFRLREYRRYNDAVATSGTADVGEFAYRDFIQASL